MTYIFKMKNQLLVAFLIINYLSVSNAVEQLQEESRILDLKVYRIESRKISEALTANRTRFVHPADSNKNGTTTIPITTSKWIDDASQKWRLSKSWIFSSFALLPTNNENFKMESYSSIKSITTWGFGYNRYWYILDAGYGFFMIKNQYTGLCIQANESNQTVSSKKCDAAISQQWKFILLSD